MVSVTNVTIGILNYLLVPLIFVNTVTDVTIRLLCPLLVPLLFVDTVTNVTIGLLSSNRGYDRCSQLEPKLLSVFSICGPFTDVTISVLSFWPPFYILMLIFRSISRMVVVS